MELSIAAKSIKPSLIFINLCKATFISTPYFYSDFESVEFQDCRSKRFAKFSYELIFSRKTRSYFFGFSTGDVTWIEAEQMCKSINGYLPFFNSRKDLNDLLYTVRFAKSIIVPMETIYIGLRYNKVGKILLSKLGGIYCFCVWYHTITLNIVYIWVHVNMFLLFQKKVFFYLLLFQKSFFTK